MACRLPEALHAYRNCIELAPHVGDAWFTLANIQALSTKTLEQMNLQSPGLRVTDVHALGIQPAYALKNLFAGVEKNGLSIELLVKNAFDRRASLFRYAECGTQTCGPGATYEVIAPPRLIGVQVGQRF